MDCILGAAVTIVRGDREAVATAGPDGVRRRATTRKLRQLLQREIASRYRTLTVDGSQGPLAATCGPGFDDGGLCAVCDWIGSGGHGRVRMTTL